MATRQIFVTHNDFRRLNSLIDTLRRMHAEHDYHLDDLANLLQTATKVTAENVPGDVVTMNSTVRLCNPGNGATAFLTLVFPHRADSESDRISVLSQSGTALFGRRSGDCVGLNISGDIDHWRIEAILYQPEAEGEDSMDYTK
jgi:regulator of nucleoside diphosphate kinase